MLYARATLAAMTSTGTSALSIGGRGGQENGVGDREQSSEQSSEHGVDHPMCPSQSQSQGQARGRGGWGGDGSVDTTRRRRARFESGYCGSKS